MTKKQFLLELNDCLEGQVNEREIKRQIHYYDQFIKSQVSDQKTESQVIDELGDPRWIAKTIITANKGIDEESQSVPKQKKENSFIKETKKWMILFIVFFCILFIFSFLFLILRFFISLLIPVTIIMIIAWIIILFKKR